MHLRNWVQVALDHLLPTQEELQHERDALFAHAVVRTIHNGNIYIRPYGEHLPKPGSRLYPQTASPRIKN